MVFKKTKRFLGMTLAFILVTTSYSVPVNARIYTFDDHFSLRERWDYSGYLTEEDDLIGFGDSESGYLPVEFKAMCNDNRTSKLTCFTGEDQKAELTLSKETYQFTGKEMGRAASFGADETHPWKSGAGINFKLSVGRKAFFLSITAEIGVSENAPRTWKMQVSYDGGKSYTDVDGTEITLAEEGVTENIFYKAEFPAPPYSYLNDYLNNKEYDPQKDLYDLRIVAVDEDKNCSWEGNTSGEVCIKQICFYEPILLEASPIEDPAPAPGLEVEEMGNYKKILPLTKKELSASEQTEVDQAVELADSEPEEAAELVNSYEDDVFGVSVREILDCYYADEENIDEGKIKAFADYIDQRAADILDGYEKALEERQSKENLRYETEHVIIMFDKGMSYQDVQSIMSRFSDNVKVVDGTGRSLEQCIADGSFNDWWITVYADIGIGRTVQMAIEQLEKIDGVYVAETNGYLDKIDPPILEPIPDPEQKPEPGDSGNEEEQPNPDPEQKPEPGDSGDEEEQPNPDPEQKPEPGNSGAQEEQPAPVPEQTPVSEITEQKPQQEITEVPKVVLKIKKAGKKKVSLSWSKVSADGYEIYAKKGNGKYKKLKTVSAKKGEYKVKNLASKKYSFKVRAFCYDQNNKTYGKFSNVRKIKIS